MDAFLWATTTGVPRDLPSGVAFPQGLPPTSARVHPTQIYEAVALVGLAVLLVRWRGAGLDDAHVLSRYLLMAGTLRFAIEFVRINERVLLGLTVAQCASLLMMAAGLLLAGRSVPAAREGTPRRAIR